jgi:O-glycosyl hydrolase
VDLARPYGFDNFTIHTGMNVRWADPWMADIRRTSYRRYLDEMAESAVAPLVYWRDKFGVVTRWHHVFNEPTTGNMELASGSIQEVVDLVKATGARFRREGFGSLRFVVASQETEEASLATARAILADPEARQYVGAISYHTYPYGSVYSDVNRILATSGAGQPDAGRVKVRKEISDLAQQFGLQVWMTEVSAGRAGPLDSLRGRAIHIHDELCYANASSYWAMYEAWDSFAERGACDEDCVVLFNRARGTVSITGIGYAIGHYARWIRRGARRIESQSDDPLVLVSSFRDDAQRRLVAVIVNNHANALRIALIPSGIRITQGVTGEQSSAAGYWLPIGDVTLAQDGSLTTVVEGRSVTTLSAPFH